MGAGRDTASKQPEPPALAAERQLSCAVRESRYGTYGMYFGMIRTRQEGDKTMEYWDIYDKDKKRTGRTMKHNDWCLKDGEYHLTVLGVIVRPDGRFLITRRVKTKSWAPGWWEVPGGGVRAGEESREAVIRELKEETGLDVSGCDDGYLFTYRRENPGEGDNYFVDVYRFVLDFDEADVRPQETETDGFMLADADQIRSLAEQGIFLHYYSIRSAFDLPLQN